MHVHNANVLTSNEKIYLDYNATTPADPRVVEAMLPYFTQHFGNASSDHSFGWHADDAIETARGQISGLLNCRPAETHVYLGGYRSRQFGLIRIL